MAILNNPFPATYPQYYQPTYHGAAVANQPVNPQPQNSGILWVQGEAGAKSYLVAPNMTVALWDSEDQKIYLKSADASGMPSMKIIDYTIRGSEGLSKAFSEDDHKYISKDEFKGLQDELEAVRGDVEKMKRSRIKMVKETVDDYE